MESLGDAVPAETPATGSRAVYNLVLVTVLMGQPSHTFAGEQPTRPPVAITSAILGTFQTLADCKAHMGTPTTDANSFDSTGRPTVQQMTYCAGR